MLSIVWACRQGQWKDKNYGVFVLEEVAKSYMFYNVLSNVIFYSRVLQKFRVSKTIPALACLIALMI